MSKRIEVRYNEAFRKEILEPYFAKKPGRVIGDYISEALALYAYWKQETKNGAIFQVQQGSSERKVILGF